MRMRHILNKAMTAPEPADTAPRPLGRVSSRDLLGGRREIIIQHGQEQYRLRLTSSNKLILIK
jgi:hemin uptake protein HemP